MAFNLSNRSRNKLDGVHPQLVAVVEGAIKLTKVDFDFAKSCTHHS